MITFEGIDRRVQIVCPRVENFSKVLSLGTVYSKYTGAPTFENLCQLSIDWGHSFDRPLLTPYELEVALKGPPPLL